MNKKTLIAGLVLFAGAPVAAQVSDVDPNSDTKIARQTVRVNPAAERAPVARSNPLDVGGVVYWGSSRGLPSPPHQIHAFDAAGVLGVSIDQIPAAQSSTWGYRDGASDGTFIYFGWEGGVARHDADGSNGILLFSGLNCPGNCRALAFDPTGDGGRGSFWTISFGSELVELDMLGNELDFFPNLSAWSVYGLSYDDTDGNLWAHSGCGTGCADVIKIDTTTGMVIPGLGFPTGANAGFPNMTCCQGGLSGFSELGGNLAAVSQGAPDEFAVFDSSGAVVLGPIPMQTLTGSNGHLGIAVIEGGACPYACLFDPDPLCDIFDFLEFQNLFVNGDPCACLIDPDPLCDIFDFLEFQNQFVIGCP